MNDIANIVKQKEAWQGHASKHVQEASFSEGYGGYPKIKLVNEGCTNNNQKDE